MTVPARSHRARPESLTAVQRCGWSARRESSGALGPNRRSAGSGGDPSNCSRVLGGDYAAATDVTGQAVYDALRRLGPGTFLQANLKARRFDGASSAESLVEPVAGADCFALAGREGAAVPNRSA